MDGGGNECVVCGDKTSEKVAKLHEKGKLSVMNVCARKNDRALEERLSTPNVTHFIHETCRRKYTDKRSLSVGDSDVGAKKRRSRDGFDFNLQCLFCGESAVEDSKHPGRSQIFMVRTLEMRESILSKCEDEGRPWREDVEARLLSCHDLVSPNARYHDRCHKTFTRPPRPVSTCQTGRPIDSAMQASFDAVCEWLENEIELHTVDELHEKLKEIAGENGNAYSEKSLREKLKSRYGEHVMFASIGGQRKDVICFKDMASLLVSETWHEARTGDSTLDAHRILRTAGRLVRNDIREREYSKEYYPNSDDLRDIPTCVEFLTPNLRILLTSLLGGDMNLKSVSLGHALTQLIKPRSVLSPLLFGLALELDNEFGSRWLIDQLYSCGFGVSYDEVGVFKNSVMQQSTLGDDAVDDGHPVQFVADNADANIRTLTGAGTFHGLGTIRIERRDSRRNLERIKRLARIKVSEFAENRVIPIRNYVAAGPSAFKTYKFKPFQNLVYPHVILPDVYYSNLLWSASLFIRQSNASSADWLSWSGFMTSVFTGHDCITEDQITILPLIDLNPNDETTLYSCLSFISNEARKMKLEETTVTFDQPLYRKAQGIVMTERIDNVVVRMGTFHMVMSAVGSIFHPMKGSGIEEALHCIYGTDTIAQIMSGKAIARAMRAIHLLYAALTTILMQKASTSNAPGLKLLLEKVYDRKDSLDDVLESCDLVSIETELRDIKIELSEKSRTSKLWIQFMENAETLFAFVACERLKLWEAHLNLMPSLLTLFAGTGHVHYATSGRLYTEQMRELPDQHPVLYRLYTEQGLHVTQRTSHAFNGLSMDLIIEQVLMRSLKTRGGLTHGRGFTESVRLQWVYAMPYLVDMHNAIEGLIDRTKSRVDHPELGNSRRKKDTSDVLKLVQWFRDNDPFDDQISGLRSLSSGLTATLGDGINCDDVAIVGYEIQQSLDNKAVADASIKRKSVVKTLSDLQPAVKINDKSFHVDPMTLFLRCVSVAQRLDEDIEGYFEYELSATAPALFDGELMRHAPKHELGNALLKDVPCTQGNDVTRTIVDGGWLINFVRWKKGSTYAQIMSRYETFVKSLLNPIVVFDGYENSTKDHEHARRSASAKKRTNRISIGLNAIAPDQTHFLANTENKLELISLLEKSLTETGVFIIRCSADADTRIVSVALNYARESAVTRIIANDTDVLVLLVHHWQSEMADIILQRPSKGGFSGYSVRDIVSNVNPVVKGLVLFAHAWSGCDTTSATYGQGKTSILKRLGDEQVRVLAEIISDNDSAAEVEAAGRNLFVRLYGGSQETTLARLRLMKFKRMMIEKNCVNVNSLPPSASAASLHSLRVHLQISEWKFKTLDPTDWGWARDDSFKPIPTRLPPAPSNVLNFIRCKCKSLKNQCGTNVCSCRKNGLKCVDVCGGCRGLGCLNTEDVDLTDA